MLASAPSITMGKRETTRCALICAARLRAAIMSDGKLRAAAVSFCHVRQPMTIGTGKPPLETAVVMMALQAAASGHRMLLGVQPTN